VRRKDGASRIGRSPEADDDVRLPVRPAARLPPIFSRPHPIPSRRERDRSKPRNPCLWSRGARQRTARKLPYDARFRRRRRRRRSCPSMAESLGRRKRMARVFGNVRRVRILAEARSHRRCGTPHPRPKLHRFCGPGQLHHGTRPSNVGTLVSERLRPHVNSGEERSSATAWCWQAMSAFELARCAISVSCAPIPAGQFGRRK